MYKFGLGKKILILKNLRIFLINEAKIPKLLDSKKFHRTERVLRILISKNFAKTLRILETRAFLGVLRNRNS